MYSLTKLNGLKLLCKEHKRIRNELILDKDGNYNERNTENFSVILFLTEWATLIEIITLSGDNKRTLRKLLTKFKEQNVNIKTFGSTDITKLRHYDNYAFFTYSPGSVVPFDEILLIRDSYKHLQAIEDTMKIKDPQIFAIHFKPLFNVMTTSSETLYYYKPKDLPSQIVRSIGERMNRLYYMNKVTHNIIPRKLGTKLDNSHPNLHNYIDMVKECSDTEKEILRYMYKDLHSQTSKIVLFFIMQCMEVPGFNITKETEVSTYIAEICNMGFNVSRDTRFRIFSMCFNTSAFRDITVNSYDSHSGVNAIPDTLRQDSTRLNLDKNSCLKKIMDRCRMYLHILFTEHIQGASNVMSDVNSEAPLLRGLNRFFVEAFFHGMRDLCVYSAANSDASDLLLYRIIYPREVLLNISNKPYWDEINSLGEKDDKVYTSGDTEIPSLTPPYMEHFSTKTVTDIDLIRKLATHFISTKEVEEYTHNFMKFTHSRDIKFVPGKQLSDYFSVYVMSSSEFFSKPSSVRIISGMLGTVILEVEEDTHVHAYIHIKSHVNKKLYLSSTYQTSCPVNGGVFAYFLPSSRNNRYDALNRLLNMSDFGNGEYEDLTYMVFNIKDSSDRGAEKSDKVLVNFTPVIYLLWITQLLLYGIINPGEGNAISFIVQSLPNVKKRVLNAYFSSIQRNVMLD